MAQTLISVSALLLSVALLIFGHGLQTTLLPLAANRFYFTDFEIGFISSAYFVGLVLGCLGAPLLIMNLFAERGRGIIVFLREGSVGVARQSRRPRSDFEAADTEEHGSAQARQEQWREVGLGAQILKDLGVSSIRLLASRERHYVGLEGFDIKIDETEILDN